MNGHTLLRGPPCRFFLRYSATPLILCDLHVKDFLTPEHLSEHAGDHFHSRSAFPLAVSFPGILAVQAVKVVDLYLAPEMGERHEDHFIQLVVFR